MHLNLRFRTRLALVMFLTMACTSGILTWAHFQHRREIMAYVSAETSYLISISQLTHIEIPPKADRNQALNAYKKAMEDAGFQNVDVANPSGEIVKSSNPVRVGKKIRRLRFKKEKVGTKQKPINISAEFAGIDPSVEERPYTIQFPIVQNGKVIGYAQVKAEPNELEDLLIRWYRERLYWFTATMLAAFFAVVYLAFRFTKPIGKLMEEAEQVAQGNLDVSLPVGGADEMGRLAHTFNHMVERLRESRELHERLNEAEKSSMLGRFAATVAHEVRNSLNFINLSIDQIRAKYATGGERTTQEIQRSLANIKDEISRLNRLVNDFMAVGRQTPPQLASCDLKVTTEQAIALVEKQAQSHGIKIASNLPASLPILLGDAAQLKTCFLNILTNAIEAMPDGGTITVGARIVAEEGDLQSVQLRFVDTGPGIRPEDRERIFAPYFSTKATGFGLGLAITKKIVEDHGGRVFATVEETHGTAMVVELPLPGTSVPPRRSVVTTSAT